MSTKAWCDSVLNKSLSPNQYHRPRFIQTRTIVMALGGTWTTEVQIRPQEPRTIRLVGAGDTAGGLVAWP